jgi:hypothetical protein
MMNCKNIAILSVNLFEISSWSKYMHRVMIYLIPTFIPCI